MTNIFKLLGDSPETAAANAKTVLDIQTRLAGASLPQVELRNPDNRYYKISFAAAQELTPAISWTEYSAARGVPSADDINLAQPNFFRELNSMVKDVSVEDWKTYLRLVTVIRAAPFLSKPFADENFKFSTHILASKERRRGGRHVFRQ